MAKYRLLIHVLMFILKIFCRPLRFSEYVFECYTLGYKNKLLENTSHSFDHSIIWYSCETFLQILAENLREKNRLNSQPTDSYRLKVGNEK